MNIGIVIPDRGDRPQLFENCLRMINAQTVNINKAYNVFTIPIRFQPVNDQCDITKRYRTGYDLFRGNKVDVIFFIENDDYYAPDYISIMVDMWVKAGKPGLFGLSYTYYYNLKLKKYYIMHHNTRSSMMNTMIVPDLNFNWCNDNEAYTDIWIWENQQIKNKAIVTPIKGAFGEICLGIKHGIGKCGGGMHTTHLHRYQRQENGYDDSQYKFINNNMDPESFNFYSNLFS